MELAKPDLKLNIIYPYENIKTFLLFNCKVLSVSKETKQPIKAPV